VNVPFAAVELSRKWVKPPLAPFTEQPLLVKVALFAVEML